MDVVEEKIGETQTLVGACILDLAELHVFKIHYKLTLTLWKSNQNPQKTMRKTSVIVSGGDDFRLFAIVFGHCRVNAVPNQRLAIQLGNNEQWCVWRPLWFFPPLNWWQDKAEKINTGNQRLLAGKIT